MKQTKINRISKAKLLHLAVCIIALLPANALSNPLKTVDLASDTAWTISIDDGPWRKIKVPGGGYNSDYQCEPLINQADVKDHATYKRSIQIPDLCPEQVTKIQFGAVNHGCNVYIDGKLIASHHGPLMPFHLDITEYVTPGNTCELKVQSYPQWHYNYNIPHGFVYDEARMHPNTKPYWAKNPGWASKFGYGITKYVKLAVYPQIYIKDIFVRPSVSDKTLTCDVWLHNHAKEDKTVTLSPDFSSWNKDNWQYPEFQPLQVSLVADEIKKVTIGPIDWNLGTESYWWPNKPFEENYTAKLHNLNLTLKQDNDIIDTKTQRFGFVQWTEGPYYYLVNGVRINQISDGTPESAMSEYDCYSVSPAFLPPTGPKTGCPETWKKYMRLGICANRTHQSTPTEYMMNVADELGFMIIPETPIRGCQEEKWENLQPFTQSVKDMAAYGRNHPGICRYSLLNEGITKHVPVLIDAILTVDDTRPLVFEDNELKKPTRIDGEKSAGHAYAMLHYVNYPKPAKIITGMGEFAWRWVMHQQYSYDVPHADGGLEEFIYYGGDMRLSDIVYFAGWDFINYWPNFLEGMSHEKHAWKQSCYHKDRVDGEDGWCSLVVKWAKKYFHPYLVLDREIHQLNKADSDPTKWPQLTSTYKPGDNISRKLEIFNDGLKGSDFQILWHTRWDSPDGPLADSGSIENIKIQPGFHKTVNLDFTAPNSDTDRRKLFIILTSKLDGSEVFKENDLYIIIKK